MKTTKTIKSSSPSLRAHFGGLPSAALTAMVAGLLRAEKLKHCRIDMTTFGRTHCDGTCFGCAATWTLQAALGRPMKPGEVNRLSAFEDQRWGRMDRVSFEGAIDTARRGGLFGLFVYMKKRKHHDDSYDGRFRLDTNNWKEQLPAVRKLIHELIKNNL